MANGYLNSRPQFATPFQIAVNNPMAQIPQTPTFMQSLVNTALGNIRQQAMIKQQREYEMGKTKQDFLNKLALANVAEGLKHKHTLEQITTELDKKFENLAKQQEQDYNFLVNAYMQGGDSEEEARERAALTLYAGGGGYMASIPAWNIERDVMKAQPKAGGGTNKRKLWSEFKIAQDRINSLEDDRQGILDALSGAVKRDGDRISQLWDSDAVDQYIASLADLTPDERATLEQLGRIQKQIIYDQTMIETLYPKEFFPPKKEKTSLSPSITTTGARSFVEALKGIGAALPGLD